MYERRDKIIISALVLIIVLLQYPLWFSSNNVFYIWRLQKEIKQQAQQNN